jgi:hypothetical protein
MTNITQCRFVIPLICVMVRRIVAHILLVVFSSIAFYNAYRVADYIVNYEEISTELCVNKNDEMAQCNGMCYLSEQIVETESQPQPFDLSQVRVNLNFLFYFFEHAEEPQWEIIQENLTVIPAQNLTIQDVYLEIPVPPPSRA